MVQTFRMSSSAISRSVVNRLIRLSYMVTRMYGRVNIYYLQVNTKGKVDEIVQKLTEQNVTGL